MIRKPKPGRPIVYDVAQMKKVADFTKHAMERVNLVLHDVGQLLDAPETLTVAANIAVLLALRAAQFARENDLIDDPNQLLVAVGEHIASTKLDPEETP